MYEGNESVPFSTIHGFCRMQWRLQFARITPIGVMTDALCVAILD